MATADVTVSNLAHWIGGKSRPSASGRAGDVWNPATGEVRAPRRLRQR